MTEPQKTAAIATTRHREDAVWLCPQRQLNIDQARALQLYKPPDAPSRYQERLEKCTEPGSFKGPTVLVHKTSSVPQIELTTFLPLYIIWDCEDPVRTTERHLTPARINLALSHLKFPICQHLLISDRAVRRTYKAKYLHHQDIDGRVSSCICRGQHGRRCSECAREGACTEFYFQTNHFASGESAYFNLSLVISRCLGSLKRPTDPAWRCHSMPVNMAQELPRTWREYTTFINTQASFWSMKPATLSSDTSDRAKTLRRDFAAWVARRKDKSLGERKVPPHALGFI